MLKLTALKKKNILLLIPLTICLVGAFVYYFSFIKLKPNDAIIITSEGTALFSNENPTFKVDFGSKENPQGQVIRFEAEASKTNPFEVDVKKSIFTKIAELFKPEKKFGIQMSLIGVNFSETEKTGDTILANNVQTVAEILGTDRVVTTTNLVDMGREIGELDTEETVSKQTIVNSNIANGIDLEYQILSGYGLKEEIVINDLEAYADSCGDGCSLPLNKFEFDLSVDDGVVLKKGWFTVEGQSTEIYYFVDGDGKYLAHFLPSYAIDKAGEKTYGVNLDIQEYSVGKFQAVVTVDSEWLLSSDRVYPIRIDPSIVHDDTGDFSGGVFNRVESVTGPKVQTRSGLSCTGGTITNSNEYTIHSFTVSGTFTCVGSGDVEVLVVAGGAGVGGGLVGTTYHAGGGGGEVITDSSYAVTSSPISVVIGAGGAEGMDGNDSSFGTITATHGNTGYLTAHGGASGSGNAGGAWTGSGYGGGGGGGAGGTGFPNSGNTPGAGGAGAVSSISGIAVTYGAGGAGGPGTNSAIANTGTGANGTAGGGASGVVIVRYIPKLPLVWGEYISSTLNLGSSMSGSTLSWLASGVATGNAETPYSTTGLVAQWNFNETSGTTAVSGGTCGTSCNGTLTNMTTTGQDAAVLSGWTANNRRWGAGAVMFDGTNDYVSVPQNANINNITTKTICTWVNLRSQLGSDASGSHIVNKGDIWFIATDPTNSRNIFAQNFSTNSGRWSFPLMETGKWNYLCAVYDRSSVSNDPLIYVNGISQVVTEYSTPSGTASDDAASNLIFGSSLANGRWTASSLDNTSIYSRALSATEILSNYQVGNIEFQYRVSTNGSTWGDWTAYNDGALVFDGMDDYINVGDNATVDTLTEFSTCTWVRPDSVTDDDYIIGKVNNSTWSGMMFLRDDVGQVSGRTDMYKIWVGQNSSAAFIEGATNSSTAGVWTHVCATFKANDASGLHLYVNGTEDANSPVSTVGITSIDSGTTNLTIGRYDPNPGSYFIGSMDNIQLYNRVLTSAEVSYNYSAVGSETPYNPSGLLGFWKFNESSGTTATNSGSGIAFNGTLTNFSSTTSRDSLSYSGWSSKSKRGSDATWSSFDNANLYSTSDLGLVAYWSLDESSGSGAYLTDKATYAPFATGGTITYSGGYTIHTFTSSGTLDVTGVRDVEVLVVAGGGGGGNSGLTGNGGGGGGGLVYNSSFSLESGVVTVTVGNGGSAATNGQNSSFSTITAYGGGAGGATTDGSSGGCGGGGGTWNTPVHYGGAGTQGYNGGDAVSAGAAYAGGGGGGMGAVGGNVWSDDSWHGGVGGNGVTYSISGTPTYYSGGGGGASRSSITVSGGLGGGGLGGGNGTSATAGTVNTGGGGGGGYGVGMAGGSGIVIVRYPSYYTGSSTAENTTPTGTTYVNGKHGGARSFNGTSDYLSCTDANCGGSGKLDAMGGSLSIEAWVKPTACSSASVSPAIVDKFDTSTSKGYLLYNEYYSGANVWTFYDPVNSSYARSTTACTAGIWTHIAAVYDASASTKKIYINGKLEATLTGQNPLGDSGSDFNIGRYRNISNYYSGLIDEVRIFNTALSATSVQSDYIQGISSNGSVYQQETGGGVIKLEGTNSNRITNSLNDGLVSYWKLDESSGTSLSDSVGSNTGTATGTSVVTGKYSNARSFNGSSDLIGAAVSGLPIGSTSRTISAWFNTASTPKTHNTIFAYGSAAAGKVIYLITLRSDGRAYFESGSGGDPLYSSGALNNGQWHQVVLSYDSTTVRLYIDGLLNSSVSTTLATVSSAFQIGNMPWDANYKFTGVIDEVKIYNIAKTAAEILEEYNATSTYYTNYTVDSNDISSDNTISVDIAGDKVGTYSSLIWGESAYANYQTDANTVGLWHLDEISGSGAYIKDSSGKNNNATPTGTTLVSGVSGNGRNFNSTSDIVQIADSDSLSFTTTMTAEGWFKTSSAATLQFIVNKQLGGTYWPEYILYVNSGYVMGYINSANSSTNAKTVASPLATYADGLWHYAAMTYDGSSLKLYVDGIHVATTAASITLWNSTCAVGIGRDPGTNTSRFIGSLDEIRLSNIARTTDEIRQAYEIGLRTHNIVVDFGAALNSGNLISGSSDTSFTVDATSQGLSQMGSNLYIGDKIVVREVSSGTEYIAQGTVSAITTATGVATVTSWDTNSTFPSGGFTTKASVFKWQTEYIPIKNRTIGTQVDAISLLTLRFAGAFGGRNMWIDNLRTSTGYINNSAGDLVTFPSSGGYLQYKAIITSQSPTVTPYLSQLQLDYSSGGPSMDQIMRHGKWFDSGTKKNFWWTGTH